MHKVHLDWDYEDQVVEGEFLVGFRLYKEGVLVSQIDDPAARSADCQVESEEGTFNFTLTAFYSGGTETPHSSPYTFTLSASTLVVDNNPVADNNSSSNLRSSYSVPSPTISAGDDQISLNQSVFAADFSAVVEGGNALSPVLVYPQVVANDVWETEICVVNGSQNVSLAGVLRPYSNDGTPLAGDLAIDLAPHARHEFRVSESFSDPEQIAYLVLAANHDQAVGYTKFFVDGQGGAVVPAVSEINTDDFYLPLTVSAPGWYTILSLVNTTNTEKLLTIRFDNGEVRQMILAPREQKTFTIASLFNYALSVGVKSATLENGAGIIGLELFIGNNKFLCGIPLCDERAIDLSYPLHIGEPGWVSGIFTYNTLNQPCNLTITSYDEQGVELLSQDVSIGAHERYIIVDNDPNLPAGSDSIHLTSTAPLAGFEVLVAPNRLGSFSGVNSSRTSGIFTKLDNADGWTGVSLVNSTAEEAHVIFSAYDDGGNLVTSHDLSIPAFGKVAGSVAYVLPGDLGTATYLKYDSSATLVACQYNNSADDQMLDVLPAL